MCPMEDDFDEGRPVTGHPPRLMLSASLPEIACGVPAPGTLRFVPVAALVGTALLKGLCPMEDDFDKGAP